MDIPEYLITMARRTVPEVARKLIVPGTTPVLSFGDSRSARVATLGINPSKNEFVKAGRLRAGTDQRLATLQSLRAESTSLLTKKQARTVVEACASYFHPHHKPYKRWFDPLDTVLKSGLGVNYYDGSACHLDLVQRATNPRWGRLDEKIKQALLQEGLPHLNKQLTLENVKLVVMLGRQVIRQVETIGLARIHCAGSIRLGNRTYEHYAGERDGVRFLGWTVNIQSNYGVTSEFKSRLARWLQERAAIGTNNTSSFENHRFATDPRNLLDSEGHIISGVEVSGKAELGQLLRSWLKLSDAATIGNIGSFGGRPCIFIKLQEVGTAALNADTKRAAVEQFVKYADTCGSSATLSVVPNRLGVLNKVVPFQAGTVEVPGWYCYLRTPLRKPRQI
jgi:hypothetical protein